MIKRRELLKVAGMVSVASTITNFSSPVLAQSLTTVSLGNNLSLISGAGCNVVVAVGPESVVVVDGGLPENAEMLLQEINTLSQGKPIVSLFNTNWRPEHSGLNYLLGGSETQIIAHENTRLWQGADFFVEWEDKQYTAIPEAAQANNSFYKTGGLRLGEETIEYGYLAQAHTDGDIYVHFVQANVLVVSDLMRVGGYPVLDYVSGGWIGGMQDASMALLARANQQTKIIAGTGPVQNKQALQKQSDMLNLARDKIGESFRSGWSLEDFKATNPAVDLGVEWGDPDLFLTQLYHGTWYHVPGRAVQNII